jgi:hypothetical protein
MPCSICKQTGHNARTHSRCHTSNIFLEETKRYNLSLQPDASDRLTTKKESYNCPICMDPIGDKNKFVTACGHIFCGTCILTNFQRNTSCPLCRGEIAPNVAFEPARTKFKRLFAPRELMDIIHERLGKTLNSIDATLITIAEKESTGENCPSLSMSLAQPILRGLLRFTHDLSEHVIEQI